MRTSALPDEVVRERFRMCLAEVGAIPASMTDLGAESRSVTVAMPDLSEELARVMHRACLLADPEKWGEITFEDWVRHQADAAPTVWRYVGWVRELFASEGRGAS